MKRSSVRPDILEAEQNLVVANALVGVEAQQQLFPAELSLARTELNQPVAVVQLYAGPDGGWCAEEERHPEQYPMRREALDRIVPGGGRPE